ncbi:nitroreductase [Clostridium gelidum]|uniref:Nitroreductase n=1 Tax=Clostridium gelidum TaxID=704125 RepID=A0ABM7T4B3_9CLOT|nr:nitroreductase family protein [Clostridium gelidum]BCZ46788.1 nitroreductase [Clostridium gelidum]
MQKFKTVLINTKEKGGLTVIDLPFNAAEEFNVKKGTIKVYGNINGVDYRNKLISRGNGKYIMSVDKKLKKKIGINVDDMEIEVTMDLDKEALYDSGERKVIENELCNINVLTAINSRQSIRIFSSKDVEKSKIDTILQAGFCAPNAKGKRPWHFVITNNKVVISNMADENNHKPFLTANCCIIVCGDKNIEGINEFLLEDCSASAQNILIAAHGLGLGATWCGLLKSCPSYKYICEYFNLPEKVIPIAVIALGYHAEEKEFTPRYDGTKVHWEKW